MATKIITKGGREYECNDFGVDGTQKTEEVKQARATGDFVACGAYFIDSLEVEAIQELPKTLADLGLPEPGQAREFAEFIQQWEKRP